MALREDGNPFTITQEPVGDLTNAYWNLKTTYMEMKKQNQMVMSNTNQFQGNMGQNPQFNNQVPNQTNNIGNITFQMKKVQYEIDSKKSNFHSTRCWL